MKIPRLLLALLTIVVVFACARAASSGSSATAVDEVSYVIRNQGWLAVNVIFTCGDGHVLKRIRQIDLGRPARGEIDLGSCRDPRFVVMPIGSDEAHASDVIQGWTAGATIFIDIASYLPLTTFRVGFTRQS